MTGQAISGWFKGLVESASKPTFDLLSATVLGTPEIASASMARVQELWGTSRWIANTCFVLLVTLAGVLMMAGQSLPGEVSVREIAPRLVWAFLASNLSLTLIGYIITFANGLSDAFLNSGADRIDASEVGKALASGIVPTLSMNHVFFVLVALVAVVLALIVAFIYVVRLAVTLVLIAAAPLALMFHALPTTDGIARLWWRGLSGMLAIQVLQALVLVSALRVFFAKSDSGSPVVSFPVSSRDHLDLLLVVGLLWVLVKIPSWVAQTIWRHAQPRLVGQLVRSVVMYHTVGMVMGNGRSRGAGASRTGRRSQGPRGGGPSGGQGRGPSGGPSSTPGGGPGGRPGAPAGQAFRKEPPRPRPPRAQAEPSTRPGDRQADAKRPRQAEGQRRGQAATGPGPTRHRPAAPQAGAHASRLAWTSRPGVPLPRSGGTGARPVPNPPGPLPRPPRNERPRMSRPSPRVALRLERSHHHRFGGARR